MAVKIKTSRLFFHFLRIFLGPFLAFRYGVRGENTRLVKKLKPPYAVMPNHVGFWDPFLVNYYLPYLVQYVVSDFQFRIPIMKFLLSLVGAVPKSKATSDFETVRNIFRIKQNKGVIGIFSEGTRNWDGCNLPPLYATSKLLKALKVPVVVPILKGAYMMLPRWKRKPNRGRVTIDFKLGFSVEEIKRMSVDEIHARLGKLIRYDEWEYQREKMYSYRGRRRAEHIELVLFTCPRCRALGQMRSSGHRVFCSSCGYSVVYNVHCFFENSHESGDTVIYDNVRHWNVWQLDYLTALIEKSSLNGKSIPLFSDAKCVVWRGYRREPMRRYMEGTAVLFNNRIEIQAPGRTVVHHIEAIHGVNVQLREVVEYYHEEALYMFKFDDPWVSGYKWMAAVNVLKGKDPVNAEFFG